MASLFSVEVVSDDEFAAIETSLQIADGLVTSQSTKFCQNDFTGVDQNNQPLQDFTSKDNLVSTHNQSLVDPYSVSDHVPDENPEIKLVTRSRDMEEVDIEDLAARCSFPARDSIYNKEPTPNPKEPTPEPTPNPLDLWGRPAIFVTTLCMQEWCEMQLDFSLRYLRFGTDQ